MNPNLDHCNVVNQSSVYTMKAEDYMQRALAAPEYATKFDFIRYTSSRPCQSFKTPRNTLFLKRKAVMGRSHFWLLMINTVACHRGRGGG